MPGERFYASEKVYWKEIRGDDQFIAYNNGIVEDTITGLEWLIGPDRETDWRGTDSWVSGLNLAGGYWRMPKISELKTLYKKGKSPRNISFLFKTSGTYLYVWSVDKEGAYDTRYFSFARGQVGSYPLGYSQRDFRAFALRHNRDPIPSFTPEQLIVNDRDEMPVP